MIDNLTIGEAKQIAGMFQPVQASEIYSRYIGKYVIVRSRNEGVNAGVVVACDETGIVLGEARRLWYHKPADPKLAWYEGVAISGLSDDSRISVAVTEKAIIENYSIVVCTDVATLSIRGAKVNEKS